MAIHSVNTNAGALLALASKRANQTKLDTVSKQLETGYRVADYSDDASVFSVAQSVRSQLKQSQAIRVGISNAIGAVEVGLSGATIFSEQMYDLKKIAIQASDGSLTNEQRNLYANDFRAKLTEMRQVLEQSTFGNRNLLIEFAVPFNTVVGTVQSYDVPADIDNNMLTVTGHRLDYVWANLDTQTIDPASAALAAIVTIDSYVPTVSDALGQLGSDKNMLVRQLAFLQDKEEAMIKGMGALVDADVAAIEAERQSVIVQQGLVTEGLSIANQRPNDLLSLFKS